MAKCKNCGRTMQGKKCSCQDKTMVRKKKEEVTTAPELEEVVVEAPVEDFPNKGVVVTVHEDRRDSGTNWNESKALPSLDD